MNHRRKPNEEVPMETTFIWACTNDGCNGWMRDNFAFDYQPTCGLCSSPMVKDTKMLPLLVNTNGDLKAIKKGVLIEKKSAT
ncbi:MAG TPA: cold-shock protein [Candidatus Bathyarchaeia archaeon]|nr:cold-shock protein [Candidatus Bathyarchaeia archaeon]